MAETLSFLNIGVETGGFNNSFQKSQDLYDKQSNILLKQSPVLKDKVDYLNGIKEEKHDNYIVATEKQKNQTLTEKNKFLNEVNERKQNTINTYKDVQNLADFSRLIEKENDEGMKALEEILGTENLYKCVLLTIAGTASEVGKGMFDVLKIGEGVAEGMLVNENKSVPTGMRLEAMLKGVGIDALRAMAIVPGAKTLLQGFAKILNKIKLPVNSNIGGNLIGNEIGAVGNVSKLKESKKISSLDETQKNYFISDLIGKNPNAVIKDLEYEIANNLKNPKNSLDNILQGGGTIEGRNIRANSWISSRLNNINNFVKYIENADTYDLPNKFKITPEGVSNLVNQIKDNTLIYVKDLIKNIDKFQDTNTFNIDYDNFKRLQTIIDKLQ